MAGMNHDAVNHDRQHGQLGPYRHAILVSPQQGKCEDHQTDPDIRHEQTCKEGCRTKDADHRKGDDGFGEGNFKALFESIERNQIARGVLDVEKEPAE